MTRLLLFSFLLLSATCSGQYYFNRMHPVSCQDDPGYYRADGGYSEARLVDRIGITQDGYFAVGYGVLENPNTLSNFNYKHPFISKLSLDGDLLYTKRYDLPEDTLSGYFSPIVSTNNLRGNDGTFPIIKSTYNYSYTDFYCRLDLLVFNYLGDTIESHFIQEGQNSIFCYKVIEDLSDSTYVVCGYYGDSILAAGVVANGLLMKIGQDGHAYWTKVFPEFSIIYSVEKIDSSHYFISGSTTPSPSDLCADNWTLNQDYVYGIYNSETDVLTREVTGGPCSLDIAYPLVNDSTTIALFGFESEEYVQGCSDSNGHFYAQKLLRNGNELTVLETRNYSYQCNRNTIRTGKKTASNKFVLAGESRKSEPAYSRGFIYKFNGNLDSMWFRTYSYYQNGGPEVYQTLFDISETPDGGFICAGSIKQDLSGPNPLLESPWIFKVDSYGCLEPGCQYVGVSEMVIGLQDAMR
ncbi:MAG: hypothetical protein RL092_537, partial [Bacteroidota bacterium]